MFDFNRSGLEGDFMNYRQAPGLNYSLLKEFKNGQEHVGKTEETYPMLEGRGFECLIKDDALGLNNFPALFIIEPSGLSKKDKTSFQLDNLDKTVLTQNSFDCLKVMVKNTLDMPFLKWTIREIIQKSVVSKPIFWEEDGILKKCELDFYCVIAGQVYIFDLKSFHGTNSFGYEIKKMGYWIQAIHYRHGAIAEFDTENVSKMQFIVGSKAKYNISEKWSISDKSLYYCESAYSALIEDFKGWDAAGRPVKGYREEDFEADIYFK